MYYVYVIKSKSHDSLYFGFTKDLVSRLKEHNNKKSFYTKSKTPWELVYFEAYKSELDAHDREKQLKRYAKGYASLKKRIYRSIK